MAARGVPWREAGLVSERAAAASFTLLYQSDSNPFVADIIIGIGVNLVPTVDSTFSSTAHWLRVFPG